MNMKAAYKQKVEAELEIAHARLDEFKAKAKNFTADTRIKYAKHLDELEGGVDSAKNKLKELGDAGEDGWEKMKDGVESALHGLRKAIHDVTEKFKD
ncbi:MAG: hypothetical protein HGA56_04930 [Chlorobiaceae bacterium]|nr:hypothetical protein [Chlorobiaceae bacterium]